MIRFKKSAAADVPAPPAGYATLFVDTATGLPAAKGSDGNVVPLKGDPGEPGEDGIGLPPGGTLGQFVAKGELGTEWVDPPAGALPAGGNVGQVVTRTEDGAEWADPATGGAPAGTWVTLLPPYGELKQGSFPLQPGPVEGPLEGEDGSIGFSIERALDGGVATRLRVVADVVLVITKQDPEAPEAGEFWIEVSGIEHQIQAGSNQVVFEFPVVKPFGDTAVYVSVYAGDYANVAHAWASIEVTQCDYLVEDAVSVATTPLETTPIAIKGLPNDTSGGFRIAKAGALSTATVIEIVGYYDRNAEALIGADALYAPRWLTEADYVAVTPTAIPVFAEGTGFEGDWGWFGGGEPLTLPDDGEDPPSAVPFLAKLRVDGAPPVLALLPNRPGYIS